MILKSVIVFLFTVVAVLLYNSITRNKPVAGTLCDEAWWNGLTQEWRSILLMNQNLRRNHVNIYSIQKGYINRLNTGEQLSEMTESLCDLADAEHFTLNYQGFYARVRIMHPWFKEYDIDLKTLGEMDTLYIVGGPGDLTPLKNFPYLQVLIANFCGYGYDVPVKDQSLDLAPLKNLTRLKALHISSTPVTTLAPLRNLIFLEELICDKTRSLTSLSPIRNLLHLKKLSIGSGIENAEAIVRLKNLEELYIHGCKPLPEIRSLKKLRKLCIAEGDFSLTKSNWRYDNIDFLKDLDKLEFLDIHHTSYKGSLQALEGLINLKAITLSTIHPGEVERFKAYHPACRITNAYEFRR